MTLLTPHTSPPLGFASGVRAEHLSSPFRINANAVARLLVEAGCAPAGGRRALGEAIRAPWRSRKALRLLPVSCIRQIAQFHTALSSGSWPVAVGRDGRFVLLRVNWGVLGSQTRGLQSGSATFRSLPCASA
jgi:hypothetical protein